MYLQLVPHFLLLTRPKHEEIDLEGDSAAYDDSEEEDDDIIMIISPCGKNRKKLTHVDATAAIDVLREYIFSLDLSGECAMLLARLQRQIIISERTKAISQQPSISSMFPSKSKK